METSASHLYMQNGLKNKDRVVCRQLKYQHVLHVPAVQMLYSNKDFALLCHLCSQEMSGTVCWKTDTFRKTTRNKIVLCLYQQFNIENMQFFGVILHPDFNELKT